MSDLAAHDAELEGGTSAPRTPVDVPSGAPESAPGPDASKSPLALAGGPSSDIPDGMAGLLQIMNRLLAPDGCAWDREQTLDSLRPYLIEEAYEVLEAMDDAASHRVELGDLLFQIVFQSALREREGEFAFADVVQSISQKMLRRHPHVFERGSESLSAEEVAKQWEAIKAQERAGETAETGPENPLAGVPAALPALQRAWRIQNKAAAVGFDWPDHHGAMAKVEEEWEETREAIASGDTAAIEEELGDLLFVLVRLAQKLRVDPEQALRATIRKFEFRFAHVMRRCHERGQAARDVGLEQLDRYWNEAKAGRNPET